MGKACSREFGKEGAFPERRVLERTVRTVKWGERRNTTEGGYRAEGGTLARALRVACCWFMALEMSGSW